MTEAKTGLWLPTSAQIHQKTPKYLCNLCDAQFYEGEDTAYERHVMSHPVTDLHEHSPQHWAPGLFSRESGDVEWGEFIRRKWQERPEDIMKWMKTSAGKSTSGLGDG